MEQRLDRARQAIERLDLSALLTPDSEADAERESFHAFAMDRLDEWHAALTDRGPIKGHPLLRRVVMVRSAKHLAKWRVSNPVNTRVVAAIRHVLEPAVAVSSDPAEAPMIARLRAHLEPQFRGSEPWQMMVSHIDGNSAIPWVAQACFHLLWVLRNEDDRPSPWAPLLDLWARGVWPLPVGDGALALWIPRREEALNGLKSSLFAAPRGERRELWERNLGFCIPCKMGDVEDYGVQFFGPEQTGKVDSIPPLALVEPLDAPVLINPVRSIPAPGLRARWRDE